MKPILFNGEMIRAILNGTKTVTRRVIKPQPDFIYSLTGAHVSCILYAGKEVADENEGRSFVAANPGIAERRLHGWKRWQDLLSDEIQRIWAQGIRGLVSFSWPQNPEGIPLCVIVPSKQENNQECTPAYLHGILRIASGQKCSNATLRRKRGEQSTREPTMGHTIRKLAGPQEARSRVRGRETSCVEIYGCRAPSHSMGDKKTALQPKTCCDNARRFLWRNTGYGPWQLGMKLWVRETWGGWESRPCDGPEHNTIFYRATDGNRHDLRHQLWRPSILMPRWASRITLKIQDVRIERVQDITEEDAKAEGVKPVVVLPRYKTAFRELWDKINAKRGFGFDKNPLVWAITFKRVKP